jgi:hypothetical protein
VGKGDSRRQHQGGVILNAQIFQIPDTRIEDSLRRGVTSVWVTFVIPCALRTFGGFEREPEQNIRHHRRLNACLADISFICGIGRSVVALPPFLTQDATPNCQDATPSCQSALSRDVRIRLAILGMGWSSSALNGLLDAAGVLSDRPVTSAGRATFVVPLWAALSR